MARLFCIVCVIMPITGGIQQQLKRQREAAEAQEAADGVDIAQPSQSKVKTPRFGGRDNSQKASIGQFLKDMYLIGRLSGSEFQEGSASCANSNASDAIINKVSKAGNQGRHRGNTHRDIMRHLGKVSDRPQVYEADVCFWDERKASQVWQACDFLLPHEILDYEVGKSCLEDWSSIRDNRYLQSTFDKWCGDVGLNSSDPDVLALGMWGDSAVIGPSESLFVLLINCLSGIVNKRFWVCAFGKKVVCQCGCHGRHTFDSIFKVIQWSCGQLLAGEKPSIRSDGIPFCDSKRVGDKARHKDRLKNKKLRVRGGIIQKRGDLNGHNMFGSLDQQ